MFQKLLVAIFLLVSTSVSFAEDKFLDYKFNDNVVIRISNIPCRVPGVDNKKFEFSVVAKRIDNQYLFGCFTHKGDNIVIQWAGGDQTVVPANVFLTEHLEPNT
ncbi:hypothetical protein UFOVP250_36 [uncultured Caudovirales phage]|uniref:Uncharacterized protein n=1 Tax=uncultured Caudovirales phage TaxID=2100421 RepID=A0A6J5LJ30_9CAUD|nr:hypothetical protein UFOVP250_36 [uncultured Caudovirales phage]